MMTENYAIEMLRSILKATSSTPRSNPSQCDVLNAMALLLELDLPRFTPTERIDMNKFLLHQLTVRGKLEAWGFRVEGVPVPFATPGYLADLQQIAAAVLETTIF